MRMTRLCLCLLAALLLALPASGEEVTGLRAHAVNYKHWGTPAMLVDGDPATAWVAGGTDPGPGKWLTFRLPRTLRITALTIANGNQGEGLFKDFRAVTQAAVVFPDGTRHAFTLRPDPGEQVVAFPPVTTDFFTIRIHDVSPAVDDPAMGDAKVAVSEVRVFTHVPQRSADKDALEETGQAVAAEEKSKAEESEEDRPLTGFIPFSAVKPGIVYLKGAVPVPPDTPLPQGRVHLDLPQDMVERIRAYFELLTRVDGDAVLLFTPSIRPRELEAMAWLRGDLAGEGRLKEFREAVVDTGGLNMDRPIVRGDSAMVRVHGIYRAMVAGSLRQAPVDALFSFARGRTGWLVNGVLRQ